MSGEFSRPPMQDSVREQGNSLRGASRASGRDREVSVGGSLEEGRVDRDKC